MTEPTPSENPLENLVARVKDATGPDRPRWKVGMNAVDRIAEAAATFLPVAPTPGSPMWKRQQAMFEAIATALAPPAEAMAVLKGPLTLVLRGDLQGRVGPDREAFEALMAWADTFPGAET